MTQLRSLALMALLFSLGAPVQAADLERGERAYKLCAGCHGFRGEGNQLVGAPDIAGQETWYLQRQLENFRQGIRGSKTDDARSQSMAIMSQGVADAAQLEDLVAYINALPPHRSQDGSPAGDSSKGRALYAPCAACHGDRAQGNEALQAPALRHLSPWAQLAQLQKFKRGQRGTDQRDHWGRQMAPMVATLADEQSMRDVVAYITSLSP